VINGNELTGFVTYHSASGRIDEGTIRSGVVGKNNDPNIIQGQIYWEGSGVTTNFRLDHTGKGLNGALSQPGELPFARGAGLKKAK